MLMECRNNAAKGIVCMLCCRKDVRRVVRIAAWGIICLSIEEKKKEKKGKESDMI